ncbi:DNA-dependent helicase II [Achromatium sp. WMS1]|nr:DNA-dependent helicase II [Achromatium sp. WMS1]
MLIDHLNSAQHQAVTTPLGNNVLVLAGAGSGKTRVLVHRVAWLIKNYQVAPKAILAVTFTNKAASELQERLEKLLDQSIKDMWVGTFHSIAHRLLRNHWQAAGLPKVFQILDADEQLRLIKRVQHTLNLNTTDLPPRKSQWFINTQKEEGRRPQHLDDDQPILIKVYEAYQTLCDQSGVVDFAELLLRTYELLQQQPKLLANYQRQFQHVLVDEFQDTNAIQYAWLQLLAKKNLFVVGDDDQSIYGWRGAKMENVKTLQVDRPNTILIRLEQNYRSTGNILQAANNLISYNGTRLEKTLWTENDTGSPVEIYKAFNEMEEARFVAECVGRFVANGHQHSEVAILYRITAQSRLFEEALGLLKLPYKVHGGMCFFDRTEIKNALAYLRLVNNTSDDIAFDRASSTPSKGFGPRTIGMLRKKARQHDTSMWQIMHQTSRSTFQTFSNLITSMQQAIQGLSLTDTVAKIIGMSGLVQYYKNFKDGSGSDRLDNLNELINVSRRFADKATSDLDAFLAYIALESGETTDNNAKNSVQLMTLHAAKGLEFSLVFIVGMEEGLFPHNMSINNTKLLEEERRLCYVGITRAMEQLYLTYAQTRRLYRSATPTIPSRFLEQSKIAKPFKAKELEVGCEVTHATFGNGVVMALEGQGKNARAQVKFPDEGTKWLMLAYADLKIV